MQYILELKNCGALERVDSRIKTEKEAFEQAVIARKNYDEVIIKRKYKDNNIKSTELFDVIAVFYNPKKRDFILILWRDTNGTYARCEHFHGTIDEVYEFGRKLLEESENIEYITVTEFDYNIRKNIK